MEWRYENEKIGRRSLNRSRKFPTQTVLQVNESLMMIPMIMKETSVISQYVAIQ